MRNPNTKFIDHTMAMLFRFASVVTDIYFLLLSRIAHSMQISMNTPKSSHMKRIQRKCVGFLRIKKNKPTITCFPFQLLTPAAMLTNPENAITGRYVHTSQNKVRCPVNVVTWTPEGRRLLTGCSSGEFTLWIGLTFNFETILQVRICFNDLQYR
jgi:hypothetical protein